MHEILRSLPPGSKVLDLGSGAGSFTFPGLAAVRADIDPGGDVQADAAALPFRNASFDAVISNHSLEHIVQLDAALAEIGRVMKPRGALYIAVPDAGTLCDRIYRWVASGGGHVNAFTSPGQVPELVTRATGLPLTAMRTLHTSLSYLNRRNVSGKPGKKWLVLGAGNETLLRWWSRIARWSDRRLRTRLSVYGWAFFFGAIGEPVSQEGWVNVCVRCGSGHSDVVLRVRNGRWSCPQCGAGNFFSASIY